MLKCHFNKVVSTFEFKVKFKTILIFYLASNKNWLEVWLSDISLQRRLGRLQRKWIKNERFWRDFLILTSGTWGGSSWRRKYQTNRYFWAIIQCISLYVCLSFCFSCFCLFANDKILRLSIRGSEYFVVKSESWHKITKLS